MVGSMVVSIGFFIFMYKFVPLAAATGLKDSLARLHNNFAFTLVDGLIRIALFLLFIWGISLWADIKRVYRYHGAEHKTVFAFEDHGMPSVADAQKYSTYHPRCGTSFLMTIMLISIFVYAPFPVQGFWAKFALRVVFLPVIASVSYELIRFSAKHGKSFFALLTKPGSVAPAHHHPAADGRAGGMRHQSARSCHGVRKEKWRRTGDCLAASAATFYSHLYYFASDFVVIGVRPVASRSQRALFRGVVKSSWRSRLAR